MPKPRDLKRVLQVLVAAAALLANARFASAQQTAKASPSVASGNNQFAFDLFNNVASAQKDANVFFSPLSISTALSMAYAGSRGETQQQMAQVLHFNGSQQDVASGFHALMTSLSPSAGAPYQLSVANALWAQQGVRFRTEFVSAMDHYYGGDFKTLNFADTEASRATINRWVSDKTSGKIPQLLHSGDIDRLTRLVLTNAVYFKGTWSSPFREELTKPGPFTTAGGAKKQAPMMHRTDSFRYAHIGDMQLLELPYEGDQLSMLILLPQAGTRHPFAELTWAKLQQWRSQMSIENVDVSLPRFKVEARLSLALTLSHMGMRDAFDANSADFSGITGRKEWFVSAVVHQAVVEVNEKGTEAAAATGVSIKATAVQRPKPPAIFRADHPFVYMIVHKPSDSIVFMGLLSDPLQ